MSLPRAWARLSVRGWATLLATITFVVSGALLVPRLSDPATARSEGRASASFQWLSRGTGTGTTSPTLQPLAGGHAGALPPAGKRTALVVGINHAKGSKTLHGAVRDAELVRDALLKYGFPRDNVVVLTEHDATAARIRTELGALAQRTPPDGRTVFAFAGHSRKRGGTNNLVAADGGLIPAADLAASLLRVRAPMWIALPTCYAGAYALPGIVGPGRVTTFASRGNEMAYELGDQGSYLIIHMVERAMLGGAAPESVERSFAYAAASIAESRPDRVPYIDDQVSGELVLGDLSRPRAERVAKPGPPPDGAQVPEPPAPEAPEPKAAPGPPPPQARVCGVLRYNCR